MHSLLRNRALIIAASCLALALGGCGEIDWNWDPEWWKSPQRVVRPTRPADEQDRAADRADASRRDQDDRATDEPREPSPTARAAFSHEGRDDRAAWGAEDDGSRQVAPEAQLPIRPYYNLYLISGPPEASDVPRGEGRINLSSVNARTCAQALEMLYVPIGRPGSMTECYLIYENRTEFENAARYAAKLDVAPISAPVSTIGPAAAFRTGIGLLHHILESGPMIDAQTAEACEQRLTEAAQSTELPAIDRWAAGILAGRVAAEYRYDYPTARSLYQQAQRTMPEGTLETMTARWWRAEAFVQEGNPAEAAVVYQKIISTYGERWKDSHVVRRSRTLLDQSRKR